VSGKTTLLTAFEMEQAIKKGLIAGAKSSLYMHRFPAAHLSLRGKELEHRFVGYELQVLCAFDRDLGCPSEA
jgi:hypothetical protein